MNIVDRQNEISDVNINRIIELPWDMIDCIVKLCDDISSLINVRTVNKEIGRVATVRLKNKKNKITPQDLCDNVDILMLFVRRGLFKRRFVVTSLNNIKRYDSLFELFKLDINELIDVSKELEDADVKFLVKSYLDCNENKESFMMLYSYIHSFMKNGNLGYLGILRYPKFTEEILPIVKDNSLSEWTLLIMKRRGVDKILLQTIENRRNKMLNAEAQHSNLHAIESAKIETNNE